MLNKFLWKYLFKCFLWFFKVQWVHENQGVMFLVVSPKDGLALVEKGFQSCEELILERLLFLYQNMIPIKSCVGIDYQWGSWYDIVHFDVKTLFLNGSLRKETFIMQVLDFDNTSGKPQVCILN